MIHVKSIAEQIEEIKIEQQVQKEKLANQELVNLEIALHIEYLECLRDMEV